MSTCYLDYLCSAEAVISAIREEDVGLQVRGCGVVCTHYLLLVLVFVTMSVNLAFRDTVYNISITGIHLTKKWIQVHLRPLDPPMAVVML